jgi:hypothetical protein
MRPGEVEAMPPRHLSQEDHADLASVLQPVVPTGKD